MKKFQLFILLIAVFALSACDSSKVGDSSKSGNISPLSIVSEVMQVAAKKNPGAILLGIGSAPSRVERLSLGVSREIDDSWNHPLGTSYAWDYFFAKAGAAFKDQGKHLAIPNSFEVKGEQQFVIRYMDGKYQYFDSQAIWGDTRKLATKDSLRVTQIKFDSDKILEAAKKQLKALYGDYPISIVAYSLKDIAYAMPLGASWMDQKGATGPVWTLGIVHEDETKSVNLSLSAVTGELVDEPQSFTMTTGY